MLKKVILFLLFPSMCFALSEDVNGWTVLSPSATSAIAYVSTSGNDGTGQTYTTAQVGSDPTNPSIGVNAYQTIAAGKAALSTGNGDWLCLKRGDEWDEQINGLLSGKDADEYFVLTLYGTTGAMPYLNKTTAGAAITHTGALQYVAIRGIKIYPTVRDPEHEDYEEVEVGIDGISLETSTSTIQYILIEGNYIQYADEGILIQDTDLTNLNINNITVRRNTILDSWSDATHSQGLALAGTQNSIIEENIFDHNGWINQDPGTPGTAVIHNHSVYYMATTVGDTIRENVSLRPSSMHLKFAAEYGANDLINITVNDNFLLDGEIGISLGGHSEYAEPCKYNYITIYDNVLFNLGESQPTNRTLAWGITLEDICNSNVYRNLIAWNDNAAVTNVMNFSHDGDSSTSSVHDNIGYESDGYFLFIYNRGTTSSFSVYGNKAQEPTGTAKTIYVYDTDENGITFLENSYFSNAASGERFYRNSTNLSFDSWVSATGDTSAWEQVSFPDTRDITDYMGYIGGTQTKAAFIAGCRAQSFINWDSDYEADNINTWIRAGFWETDMPMMKGLILN